VTCCDHKHLFFFFFFFGRRLYFIFMVSPPTRHIEYSEGNTNLIFTVPHDGQTKPTSFKDRTNGCKDQGGTCQFPGPSSCPRSKVCKALLWSDSNTLDFARRVRAEVKERTGLVAHLVVNHVHRSKLDANRPIEDAAQGSAGAEAAYTEFHETIERTKERLGGPGLLLDFHGQRHGRQTTELGYGYRKAELNAGDLGRLGPVSSVSSLLARTGQSPEELLTGPDSLGAMWEAAGYKAVPGPAQPTPGRFKYYRGGYITQTHGSSMEAGGGQVDAIQLELPSELTNTTESRRRFATKIGGVVAEFYDLYYLP